MAGTTPNLALYLPGGGSTGVYTPDEVADIDPLNQNFVKLDTFAGTVGVQTNQNKQFYGPAAAISAIVGMKLGDTYQESDSQKNVWRYSGTNWTLNEGGLFVVRPTSLSGATQNVDGSVSFAGVGSFNMLGLFSSAFSTYKIVLDTDFGTASTGGLQFLVGSTATNVNYYNGAISLPGATTVTATQGGNTATVTLMASSVTALQAEFLISRPFSASNRTRVMVNSFGMNGAGQAHVYNGGGIQTDTVSFDGLRILSGGPTMSGRLIVYGVAGV